MKIVIIGAGAVGFELARTISRREHDVWLVERDQAQLDLVQAYVGLRRSLAAIDAATGRDLSRRGPLAQRQ